MTSTEKDSTIEKKPITIKKIVDNIIGWLILIGFGLLLLGVIYFVKVMPYDNDWTCIIAECRKVK